MRKQILLFAIMSLMFLSTKAFAQGLEPNLINPVDNADCLPKDVNFEWELKPSVVTYDLMVTLVSGDYSNPVVNKTGLTTTSFAATLPTNDVTYYWKVRANYSGTFGMSDEFEFTTKKAGTTTIFPTLGQSCVNSPITFEWDPMQGATSYQIQASTNQSFAGAEINVNNLTSSTYSSTLSQSLTDYYWRVRANYTSGTISCTSEWSNSSSFQSVLQKPTLDSPANNSVGVDFSVNLSWTGQAGSSSYTIQVAEDSDFNNVVFSAYDTDQSSTIITLPTSYNKSYYWRVSATAQNFSCFSDWSNTFTFKTRYQDVVLSSPENNASCIPVNGATLTWEETSTMTKYRLQVSETAGFPLPVQFDIPNLESNTYTMDLPASLKNYYWRVRAEDATNNGNWSPTREFKSGLFSPKLLLPINDSTETYIITSLKWESQNAISNYNLQIATNPSFAQETIVLDTLNLTEPNLDVTLKNYGQNYYWRVSSTFSPCLSNWSSTNKFTTMTGTSNLVYPADNATATQLEILFDWSDVKYAVNYDLEVSTSPNFDVIEKGRIAIDTSLILISGLKPTTKYYWRVRVNTGISKAPYSVVRSFTTGIEPSIRPLLISPKNLAEKIPVSELLKWTKSDKAEHYEVQVSKDENFTDIAITNANVTDTTLIVSDLENYKIYSWRVRSANSAGVSSWTEPWKFRTIAPAITDAPTLELPANNATSINHKKAKFQWFEVDNTTSVDGAYQVQISTTDNFADGSVVVDTKAVFVNEYTSFNLNHTTKYYWRVRGFNEVGDGPWSETWAFNTLDFTSVDSKFIKNVELFPNPSSNDKVKVNFNLVKSGETTIKVIDVTGNLVLSSNLNYLNAGYQFTELNVAGLSSGNYFVVIENGANSVISPLKIIK